MYDIVLHLYSPHFLWFQIDFFLQILYQLGFFTCYSILQRIDFELNYFRSSFDHLLEVYKVNVHVFPLHESWMRYAMGRKWFRHFVWFANSLCCWLFSGTPTRYYTQTKNLPLTYSGFRGEKLPSLLNISLLDAGTMGLSFVLWSENGRDGEKAGDEGSGGNWSVSINI